MTTLATALGFGSLIEDDATRKVYSDDNWRFSILDTLKAVTNDPKQAWARFKASNPTILDGVQYHQFSGPRQRLTPVAAESTLVEIMFKMPGAKARAFSLSAARMFVQALKPSAEYVEELKERSELLTSQSIAALPSLLDASVQEYTRTYSLAPRCHNETTLYVRVRTPEEFIAPSDYAKQLTLWVLKFGLTYSMHGRNGQYARNTDNGCMAFSFPCSSRKQAQIIEDILIMDFTDAAVLGSREYIDVAATASMLGCEYESGSYSSYIAVAQQLYAYMLQRIHMLWPRTSHMYGCSYDIIVDNSTLVRSTEDDSVVMHSDLSFRCNIIDAARALQLGLVKEQPPSPEVDEPPAIRDVHPSTLRMLGGVEDRSSLIADDDGVPVSVTMKAKLDRFIDEMCEIDPRGTVSSKEISGQYRLWAREDGKIIFSAVLSYMGERFRYERLKGQSMNTVVNGYIGVKLKPTPVYALPVPATSQEEFLFETCDRGPEFKCVQKQLVQLYQEWVLAKRGEKASKFEVQALVDFVTTNFFKANIWIGSGKEVNPGLGFWGLGLKIHSHFYRAIPTTSKRVWMIRVSTGEVIPVDEHSDSWPTIALAADSRNWCTAKMSRAIEKATIYDDIRYTTDMPTLSV